MAYMCLHLKSWFLQLKFDQSLIVLLFLLQLHLNMFVQKSQTTQFIFLRKELVL